ncbi:unnamed protein product [Caretta caretta]
MTSSDVSHVETESLHVKDQETQADLERLSNLEGSEYSDQAGIALKEMQTGFEFTVQIAEYKDNKKQQQHEKMDASRGTPTSSYFPDDMTEGLDGKRQAVHLENRAKREADALQPEGFNSMGEISNLEELEQPCSRRITATDLELEKMRWDSALTRLKHKQEDNEKQRQHEKTMEQLRQQATPRSFGQGLYDLLRPQNQLYSVSYLRLQTTVINGLLGAGIDINGGEFRKWEDPGQPNKGPLGPDDIEWEEMQLKVNLKQNPKDLNNPLTLGNLDLSAVPYLYTELKFQTQLQLKHQKSFDLDINPNFEAQGEKKGIPATISVLAGFNKLQRMVNSIFAADFSVCTTGQTGRKSSVKMKAKIFTTSVRNDECRCIALAIQGRMRLVAGVVVLESASGDEVPK